MAVKRYLVDSDVFLQGKNFHYSFDFCEGFWDWIRDGHEEGVIFSIKKVRAELVAGKKGDAARIWAENMPSGFFLDDEYDSGVMGAYKSVMEWSIAQPQYFDSAKEDFADAKRADAFLLACAKHYGHVIVTQEKGNPDSKRSIKIPDAAAGIEGIAPTITIWELLRMHAKSTFVFTP